MNLKSMSIDKLSKLREQVAAALNAKVIEERRTVQDQLSKLDRVAASGSRGKGGRGGMRGAVAPKYRNPDNPSETWAGRGLKPRWLAAAIKAGHKIEEFLIGGAPKAAVAVKKPKATRKRRAAAQKSSRPRKAVARKAKAARAPAAPRKASASKATPQPEASA